MDLRSARKLWSVTRKRMASVGDILALPSSGWTNYSNNSSYSYPPQLPIIIVGRQHHPPSPININLLHTEMVGLCLCLWLGGQSPHSLDSFALEFLPKYCIEDIWLILRQTVTVILSNHMTLSHTEALMMNTRIVTNCWTFWFSSISNYFNFIIIMMAVTSEIIWPKVVFLPFSFLPGFWIKPLHYSCVSPLLNCL